MDFLHIIGGPAVGALIGYCTNYIAVKMLFRPLKPIKIGTFTLPFTPGIMPKRKPALAKALGTAVGNTLLTTEDLKKVLVSENVKNSVIDMFITQANQLSQNEKTMKEVALTVMKEGNYDETKGVIVEKVTDKVMENLEQVGIGNIVVEEAKKAVREKMSGSFVAMFLNEDLMDSLAQPIGEYVESYICREGRNYVEPMVEREMDSLEQIKVGELIQNANLDFETMKEQIEKLYVTGIETFADTIVNYFKVAEIIEEKVNAMPVEELEKLVLSVMKHELQMVVNLGALIGLVLGILNLAF